jgi:DNA invertase Pin-like site-specific DNA recombinase
MKKSDSKIIAFYYRSAVKDEKRLAQWKKQIINNVKENKIDNYKLYIDNGFSGASMERPDLKRLMADMKDGKIATVIVTEASQLSRNQAHHLKLEQLFKENDVNYFILPSSGLVRPYKQA